MADDSNSPHTSGNNETPFIAPNGQPIRSVEMQRLRTFSPELEAALKQARDGVDNRYMICVFTANEQGETVNLHTTRGSSWRDEWYLRSFQLFVADHHRISPDILNGVKPVVKS